MTAREGLLISVLRFITRRIAYTTTGSRLFSLALLSSALTFPMIAQGQPAETYAGTDAVKSEVILQLRTTKDDAALASLKVLLDADQVIQISGDSGPYIFHSRRKTVAELLDLVAGRDDVVYAEPNYLYHTMSTPNDPGFSSLWSFYNVASPGADIHVVPAWDISTGSRQNIVAVLDTGVDYTHPDLAANIWTAPASFTVNLSYGTLTCPAGSHGYNALAHTCDPMDSDGHGTHVAGILGAVGNNLIGITGVNWVASIMPIRIASTSALGTVSTSDAIDAIEFAIQVKNLFASSTTPANVRVLSNSWGGNPFSQALLDEIQRANTNDMLFVAAAGNLSQNTDLYPLYPAAYSAPNIISVAATNSSDGLASFSNYGPATVHLGAPGTTIYSTWPGGTYRTVNGTSMSTPHVSGAAALVLSACNLNTANLKSTLLSAVDLVPALSGKTITGGRLDVNNAIRSCVPPPASRPTKSAVSFVKVDVATQGGWKGRYGGDGWAIPGDSSSYPAYVQVSLLDPAVWTWAATTADSRAPQKAASVSDRVASTWYDANGFVFDLNLIDGEVHQIALYLLDWDFSSRAERVDIMDAGTGSVLDTRNIANFSLGKYVVWNLSGHIQIRVTLTGAVNAVTSGIFFDAPGVIPDVSTASAVFQTLDSTTQGSWKGVYGVDGYGIVNDSSNYPGYVQISAITATPFTWANSTTDGRALEKAASSTDRIASSWYNSNAFWYDMNFTDGNSHQVALYVLDWDFYSRTQRIDVLDLIGNVLDTRTVSNFGQGQYVTWTLRGHVQIQVTRIGAGNAVVSGVFFSPPNGVSTSPDFTVAVSPGMQAITVGGAGTYSAVLTGVNGFTGTVSLNVAGLPSGATGTFSPAIVAGSGTSILSVATSQSTAAGTYQLTVTGTGGSAGHSATATLVVNSPPDFSIAVSPNSQAVVVGTGVVYTATLTAANGFMGPVALTVGGLPTGTAGTFSPPTITGSGNATLSITTSGSTPPGAYQFTVTATSNGLVHSATTTFIVNAAPDFGVTISPTSQTILAGTGVNYGAAISGLNGFTGAVTFSVAGLPTGAGGTFSPTTITGTGTATLSIMTTGSAQSGTYQLTVTGSSGALVHSANATLVINGQPTATTTFLKIDTMTMGTWKGQYGRDGFAIVNDSLSYPAYAQVSISNALSWTWVPSSMDTRALQKTASPTDRIAATWYNNTGSFQIDVNLIDGNTHQVALYVVDWDFSSRAERIDIVDQATGVVLDSRGVSRFVPGKYLVWNLIGHVLIRVTLTGLGNPVVSGIFFDPAGAVPPILVTSATFLKTDATTQGSWKGQYGGDGGAIANDSSNYPSYAQVAMFNATPFTWVPAVADVRALQSGVFGASRIASCWYTSSYLLIDVSVNDNNSHQLALYVLDWDELARVERVDILDVSGNILDTRIVSNFGSGVYLVWDVHGHTQAQITLAGAGNVVLSGLFFATP